MTDSALGAFADPASTAAHYAARLAFETDASDVAAALESGIPVIVHCWGPGCNGAAKAARDLAGQGVAVKEMLGGFEYWAREGYPVEGASGPIHRPIDPLTAPVEHAISCDC